MQKAVRARKDKHFQAGELVTRILSMQIWIAKSAANAGATAGV